MALYRTAEYRVKDGMAESVERAMQDRAADLKEHFPGFLWWTAKSKAEGDLYLTFMVSPDEATFEAAAKNPGNELFVEALYPNVVGEIKWTDWTLVDTTHLIP